MLNYIHCFRSISKKGLFELTKDIARLTADNIDIVALQKTTVPPKGEKWGALKSLEKVLAMVCTPKEVRRAITPLVGVYQHSLSDARLPGSDMAEAMKLAGIDGIGYILDQGRALISNCSDTEFKITSLLAKLPVVVGSEEKND